MKICASNSTYFTKIEEALKAFKKEFLDNFDIAELVLESNFSSEIKLVNNNNNINGMLLPKEFIITQVDISLNTEDTDVIPQKHTVIIKGHIEKQEYALICTEILSSNIRVFVQGGGI